MINHSDLIEDGDSLQFLSDAKSDRFGSVCWRTSTTSLNIAEVMGDGDSALGIRIIKWCGIKGSDTISNTREKIERRLGEKIGPKMVLDTFRTLRYRYHSR